MATFLQDAGDAEDGLSAERLARAAVASAMAEPDCTGTPTS